MKPMLIKMSPTLILDVKAPESCLISLMFKIDHLIRRSFLLKPNTSVDYKTLFKTYWRKLIDQEENQTEQASMEAVSFFAKNKDE